MKFNYCIRFSHCKSFRLLRKIDFQFYCQIVFLDLFFMTDYFLLKIFQSYLQTKHQKYNL